MFVLKWVPCQVFIGLWYFRWIVPELTGNIKLYLWLSHLWHFLLIIFFFYFSLRSWRVTTVTTVTNAQKNHCLCYHRNIYVSYFANDLIAKKIIVLYYYRNIYYIIYGQWFDCRKNHYYIWPMIWLQKKSLYCVIIEIYTVSYIANVKIDTDAWDQFCID